MAVTRIAAVAHAEQTVPGTELPYLLHVTQVAMEVAAALRVESGHDEDLVMQCALLHDTLEYTIVTYTQLAATFGSAVANGVLALSKDPALPKEAQMADSLRRIQLQPRAIWLVKLVDRIVNLQAPPKYWPIAKIAAYREEACGILDTLGKASPLLAARLMTKLATYGIEQA